MVSFGRSYGGLGHKQADNHTSDKRILNITRGQNLGIASCCLILKLNVKSNVKYFSSTTTAEVFLAAA